MANEVAKIDLDGEQWEIRDDTLTEVVKTLINRINAMEWQEVPFTFYPGVSGNIKVYKRVAGVTEYWITGNVSISSIGTYCPAINIPEIPAGTYLYVNGTNYGANGSAAGYRYRLGGGSQANGTLYISTASGYNGAILDMHITIS